MSINDGTADREPHPRSIGLSGVECLEDVLDMRGIDTGPQISHCHEDTCRVPLSRDRQLSRPRPDAAHRFNRVENQVEHDLLQLNAIAMNRERPFREPSLDRDPIVGDCAPRQSNHLVDSLIQIEASFAAAFS